MWCVIADVRSCDVTWHDIIRYAMQSSDLYFLILLISRTHGTSINSITMSTEVNGAPAVEEYGAWLEAITREDGYLARSLLGDRGPSRSGLMLQHTHLQSSGILEHIKRQCVLTSSPYIPDNILCLATIFNARNVLNILREFGISATERNSYKNNFLHCIIAYASTKSEACEIHCKNTIIFMRSLMTDDEHRDVLLAENNDGVRPLELASHLGTFILFQFLFDSKPIYLKKTRDLAFYTVYYYDITEYITGSRLVRDPLHGMMLLDSNKLYDKSQKSLFKLSQWWHGASFTNMV